MQGNTEHPRAKGSRFVTRRTWVEEQEVPQIVHDYLQTGYSLAHYEAMAMLVEKKLSSLLEKGGVAKCKLSRRAKDPKSLKEKLIIRNRDRKEDYKDFQEIKKDIVDLAAVRIILYMPTQEDNHKVKEVIQKEWGQGIVPKIHPPPRDVPKAQPPMHIEPGRKGRFALRCTTEQAYRDILTGEDSEAAKRPKSRPLHLGYRAVHYRVPMKENEIGKNYQWLQGDQVEIQVVSALTHAWAEVGHDILYKSLAEGRPSLEEERILDAMNGLIQSGELLLQQFQKMYIRRTSQPFKYPEDLIHFLRSFLNPDDAESDLEPTQFPREEGTYILFKFLQKRNLNTPSQILSPLEALGYPFHYHSKEELVRRSFRPIPKLAPKMSLVVCLTRHLLFEIPYEASSKSKSVPHMCSVMMSALTLLDFCLGGPKEAKEYLQKLDMTHQQIMNINFLLESSKRYEALLGEMEPTPVRDSVEGAWEWFCFSAGNPTSFCGFLFQLAEMGCKKDVEPGEQLAQLQIQPLSRSITSDLTRETGLGAEVAQLPKDHDRKQSTLNPKDFNRARLLSLTTVVPQHNRRRGGSYFYPAPRSIAFL